jgi:hypothetical protein
MAGPYPTPPRFPTLPRNQWSYWFPKPEQYPIPRHFRSRLRWSPSLPEAQKCAAVAQLSRFGTAQELACCIPPILNSIVPKRTIKPSRSVNLNIFCGESVPTDAGIDAFEFAKSLGPPDLLRAGGDQEECPATAAGLTG